MVERSAESALQRARAPGEVDHPAVIFISSASRSGSTLLDMCLGGNEAMVSVGELYHLQGYALKSYEEVGFKVREYPLVCTCGLALRECGFWSSVERESGLDFNFSGFRSHARVSLRRLVQAIYFTLGPRGVRWSARAIRQVGRELEIAANCYQVYGAVARLTGASYVIDSSKSMYQYLLLHSFRPSVCNLIRLYRDGRAVSCSMVRGERVKTFDGDAPFDHAVKAWRRANRLASLLGWRTEANSRTTVLYEGLCERPEDELNRICSDLGIEVPRIRPTLGGQKRHNIGGSPSRFRAASEIRLDERWKEELTPDRACRFEKLGGSMNRNLGYR